MLRGDGSLRRETWLVAAAGLAGHLRDAAREFCTQSRAFKFSDEVCCTGLCVEELTRTTPDIVVLDEVCLNGHGLKELARLHHALPESRTLLIGDSFLQPQLIDVLRVGVWGVLSRIRAPMELQTALQAIARDELWLSRAELCGVVKHALTKKANGLEESKGDRIELTPRENAVMRKVVQGQSNKEIARTLGITEHTVKIHIHHILSKLHLRRRVELIVQHQERSE